MNKIIWPDASLADLQGIFVYIAEDNYERATSFVADIRAKVDKLIEFPLLGVEVEVSRPGHFRALHHLNYTVIYEVDRQQIIIQEIVRQTVQHRRIELLK